MSKPAAVQVNTIMEHEEDKEEEDSKENAMEELKSVCFMEPDHEEVRTSEDSDIQEYWETGITSKSLSMQKAGNLDHSQKEGRNSTVGRTTKVENKEDTPAKESQLWRGDGKWFTCKPASPEKLHE